MVSACTRSSASNGRLTGFERSPQHFRSRGQQASSSSFKTIITYLQAWLQFNRHQMCICSDSHTGTALGNLVGRFKLSDVVSMDQTPLSYEFMHRPRYERQEAKTVWLKQTRSGWDRRQATVQIYARADGVARCRPQFIFEGTERGQQSRAVELKSYHPGVGVIFISRAGQMGKRWFTGLRHHTSVPRSSAFLRMNLVCLHSTLSRHI